MKTDKRCSIDFDIVSQFQLVVPEDYEHSNLVKFKSSSARISFPEPTDRLIPGQNITCTVFKQSEVGQTTTKERINFLKSRKGNLFLGVWGLVLIKDQKRCEIKIPGCWYHVLDKKTSLLKDACWSLKTPGFFLSSLGDLEIITTSIHGPWNEKFLIIGFSN